MKLILFTLFCSFLNFGLCASYSSRIKEDQDTRIEKECKKKDIDNKVLKIFRLIRKGCLEDAETLLKKDELIPDSHRVIYQEREVEGKALTRIVFREVVGGKSYLWGSLALAYLKQGDLGKAQKAQGLILKGHYKIIGQVAASIEKLQRILAREKAKSLI